MNSREVYEGWTVQDFINELEITFGYQKFKNRRDLVNWCCSEQPFYKKPIPEVIDHFLAKTLHNGTTIS